jgi:hypothetical protein
VREIRCVDCELGEWKVFDVSDLSCVPSLACSIVQLTFTPDRITLTSPFFPYSSSLLIKSSQYS